MKRWLLWLPLGGFLILFGFVAIGLVRPAERTVASRLVGQPLPAISLPPLVPGHPGLDASTRGPRLINIFASWCVPCVIEHPQLMALSREGLPIWGVAYKDKPEAAAGFLARHGNPFARVARDAPGQVAIDWGVYGVPESYLIDAQGLIRWRYAGPLTPEVVTDQLRPLLRQVA